MRDLTWKKQVCQCNVMSNKLLAMEDGVVPLAAGMPMSSLIQCEMPGAHLLLVVFRPLQRSAIKQAFH